MVWLELFFLTPPPHPQHVSQLWYRNPLSYKLSNEVFGPRCRQLDKNSNRDESTYMYLYELYIAIDSFSPKT